MILRTLPEIFSFFIACGQFIKYQLRYCSSNSEKQRMHFILRISGRKD
jgi:hypothetical protein